MCEQVLRSLKLASFDQYVHQERNGSGEPIIDACVQRSGGVRLRGIQLTAPVVRMSAHP